MFLGKGLSKPADNVGQQAKDNLHGVERQASAGMQYEFFSTVWLLHQTI